MENTQDASAASGALDRLVRSAADNFHAHLDACARCRNNPFALCKTGASLIEKAATEIRFITPEK